MEFLLNFLKKRIVIGVLLILSSAIMREILSVYSTDYSSLEIMIYRVIGGIFFLCGIGIIIIYMKNKKSHEMDFTEGEYGIGGKLSAFFPMIKSFLQEITAYFMSEKITENMPIQKYCTQTYKNILDLHKRRLDRCQVQLEWKSIPRRYTNHSYQKKTYFEGKYEITEFNQQIESKRRYSKDHHKLMLRNDKEFAHFTIINAKKTGVNEIICPNCGCTTTRENLIDGCDYCGARFTVEDLGKKISDFSLRDNADLAYEKFKERRLDRGYIAFLIFFWMMFAFMAFIMMVLMVENPGSGDPMNPLFFTFSVVGVSACFAYIFALCLMACYLFVIFPVTEIFGNVRYRSKKRVQEMKNHEQQEDSLQKKIQEEDALFSLTGFYSNIQNKLNTIFYAETNEQLNAFSEEDLSKYHDLYNDVIDFDIEEMNLEDYRIDNGYQLADINAKVNLFELKPSYNKVITKKQHIKIQMIKSVNSKTKAVCQPYILSCPNCGNSLSLLNGMICNYCGTKPDLKEYDWTIQKYVVSTPSAKSMGLK